MKKTEESGKRRRVMEVVEVSDSPLEEKISIEKEAVPDVSQKSPDEIQEKQDEIKERNISDDFEKETVATPEVKKSYEEPPLTQKDIVSELFKPQEKPVSVGYPDISVRKKPLISPLSIWVAIMVVCVGVISYVILSFTGAIGGVGGSSAPTPTPTGTEAAVATPTPTVAIVKKDFQIQVLNGSGKSGVAGTMKTLLEESGYTVKGTGNADNFDYENVVIVIKKGKESLLQLLKTDVATKYTVGSTSADLSESKTYDAEVIVGK